MYEKSYGIISVQKQDCIKVLMVHHQDGHWTFPKGRPETGELPKESARRELKEELGLEIKSFLDLPSVEENYTFFRKGEKIEKEALYFFAEVWGEIHLQIEEISEAKWLNLDEAYELATSQEGKNLVQKIQKILVGCNSL